MDGAAWKKIIAQIEDIYDLFEILPVCHPIIAIWRERIEEIEDKTKKRKIPPGKRESATLDNIEYFLRSLLVISRAIQVPVVPAVPVGER